MTVDRRPSPTSSNQDVLPSTPTKESILQGGLPTAPALTPPTSPPRTRTSSNISKTSQNHDESFAPKSRPTHLEQIQTNLAPRTGSNNQDPWECPWELEILQDDRGRDAIFGTGAWSIVYKATTHLKSTPFSGSWTPPQSPICATTPSLVAVKKPTRRDAAMILKNEAKVLSYLHVVPDHEKYIVPFYGTVDTTTIVLQAIPFSLETHLRHCSALASKSFSTATMAEPVIGSSAKWLHLASQLITSLEWLHNQAQVIHGDIKPGNILLSHVSGSGIDMTFQPVFADFSSAQRLDLDETTPNTLSAVTREYTAPELLRSSVLSNPESTATPASDVFSLAVTLLVAATGQMLVYSGSVFQRQLMATQGWMILNHVRNGPQGSRVPKFGIVERVLETAVLKADMGRVSADQWLDIVDHIARGEPMKL